MTDFFDEDLVRTDNVSAAERRAAAARDRQEEDRLARQHEAVSSQVATTVHEIELLRRRQEQLEKEKNSLEHLAHKQEEYENGKREIMEALAGSIVGIEKDEAQATRMAELLGETRTRFQDALVELSAIDENKWEEGEFFEELNRALALVRDRQTMYRKAIARIDAAGWHKVAAAQAVLSHEPLAQDVESRRGFGYWLKVGLAVTLPVVVAGVAVFVVWLFLSGMF